MCWVCWASCGVGRSGTSESGSARGCRCDALGFPEPWRRPIDVVGCCTERGQKVTDDMTKHLSAAFDTDPIATRFILAMAEFLWAAMLWWPGDTFGRPTYAIMARVMPEGMPGA